MNNLLEILSDNDIVVVTIYQQDIVKKQIENFEPASLLIKKSKALLSSLEENKLIDELKMSPSYHVKVTDLDNNNNIVEVISSIRLTVYNYKLLKKEQLKEIICAIVHTSYGSLTLKARDDQDIV